MATLPTGFTADPDRLLALAGEALDAAAPRFVEGVGAPASVAKGPADFATDLDLELERRITAAVAEATGVPVHGEEYGGPAVDEGTVWVLDPIDATKAFATGRPLFGILIGLVHEGEAVLGIIDYYQPPQWTLLALDAVVAIAALLALRYGIHAVLLHEEHEVQIGPPRLCPHCEQVVPAMPFCPHCGYAPRAASRSARSRLHIETDESGEQS